MPVVATSQPAQSEGLKYESGKEWGHCRQVATVLVAAGMGHGSVVKNDGDDTYSWVAAANVATLNADVGIVIDDRIYDAATGDGSFVILSMPHNSGSAGYGRSVLNYADALSAPQQLVVETALTAKGISILDQVPLQV